MHHNAWFPAGREAIKQAQLDDAKNAPNKSIEIHQVLHHGPKVAIHSHITPEPGHAGYSVVHIFRFNNGKIVEMWDVVMEVPADCPNGDGVF